MHCPNTFALYRLLTITGSWVNLLHHYTVAVEIGLAEKKPTLKKSSLFKGTFLKYKDWFVRIIERVSSEYVRKSLHSSVS